MTNNSALSQAIFACQGPECMEVVWTASQLIARWHWATVTVRYRSIPPLIEEHLSIPNH